MENTSIRASLRLVGDEFDVNYVTEFLDRKPDYLRIKGEVIRNDFRAGFTAWGILIDESESLDTNTHLIPIFDFIEQNLEKLQLLSYKMKAEWQISVCITICHERTPSVGLVPKHMKLASAINAVIDFDLYASQFNIDEMASLDKCPLCGIGK